MSAQLALFTDLPRTTSPRRGGRPVLITDESVDLLGQAATKLALAAETRGHLNARHFVGRAADLLRRAGAKDLAEEAYRALDNAIGHPDVERLAKRINARIARRTLKLVGVA